MPDLFDLDGAAPLHLRAMSPDAVILEGFARQAVDLILEKVLAVARKAPFRHMLVPGGHRMSAATTNCGPLGWTSDRSGYRYCPRDPLSDEPWPGMPPFLRKLSLKAAAASGYSGFEPDACLITRYAPGARLALHQDKNERDYSAPIVSLSLGLPATFLFGGTRRSERPKRFRLESGDAGVWGRSARLVYHGVAPLPEGADEATGRLRYCLTFRRAG